jgi:uncharacterized protein YjbI with pentapeptide repeats
MRGPASAGQACERCSRAAYLHGAKMAEADLVGVDLTRAYLGHEDRPVSSARLAGAPGRAAGRTTQHALARGFHR